MFDLYEVLMTPKFNSASKRLSGCPMNFPVKQQEIDAILKTLDEAKRYSGLRSDDPAMLELERIMMTKVAELESAKTEAAQALEERHADRAKELEPSSILFAAIEDDAVPAPSRPEQMRAKRP
jgi:hypothetical protein